MNKAFPAQVGGTHYDKYKIEPIAALKDWLSTEEFRGYLRGCALKYQVRYRDKGGVEDLRKAQWFLKEPELFEREFAEVPEVDGA